MFGLSHVVRQRLNTSLTINTRTSDTGAPRQPVFSILSFSHLEKSPSHDPSITTYSKSTQHYLFTYLMCSNNICKAEKQIKANHFLRTPDIQWHPSDTSSFLLSNEQRIWNTDNQKCSYHTEKSALISKWQNHLSFNFTTQYRKFFSFYCIWQTVQKTKCAFLFTRKSHESIP